MRVAVSRNRRQLFFDASERAGRHGGPVGRGRRGAPRRRIKALRGVKHHVGAAECPVVAGDVVPRDERSRLWPEGGTTSETPIAWSAPAMWCPATKVQGFGRGKAPRRRRRLPGRARRRGAPRRRVKALARVKHHVRIVRVNEESDARRLSPSSPFSPSILIISSCLLLYSAFGTTKN